MKTITVFCNAALLNVNHGSMKPLAPLEISKPFWNGTSDSRIGECVFAAIFYEDELNSFTEEECEAVGAFWREIGSSNVDWEDHSWQTRIARDKGIFHWICDELGASQPRNVAAILGDICRFENKTPVEFFNSLPWSAAPICQPGGSR